MCGCFLCEGTGTVQTVDGAMSDCPICRRSMRYTLSGRLFLLTADLLIRLGTRIAAGGIRRGLPYGDHWRPADEYSELPGE